MMASNNNIPIVQGVSVAAAAAGQEEGDPFKQAPVPQSYHNNTYYSTTATATATPVYDDDNNMGGFGTAALNQQTSPDGQPRGGTGKCQDAFFGVLFLFHLVVMAAVIGLGLSSSQESLSEGSYGGIITLVVVTAVAAVALSTFLLGWMMAHAKTLVQMALIFSVVSSLAVGILGFLSGAILMGVIGLVSFLFGCCYAYLVWQRIPFAAANLNTALTAVKANLGLAVVAYLLTGLAFLWTVLWMLGLGNNLSNQQMAIVFLLFVSYYWVHQVLQNLIHVTTAGVVGTWWFAPLEASTCCSRALYDSLYRSCTLSFGSICLGSLLVAIVQALRALEHYSRSSDDDNCRFLSCIIQCILACIQSILEEFTKFAYIYIGLYGFSFVEASKNVLQLFENKGWTVIITDDLTDNVLTMMSVAVGMACGLVGLIVGLASPNMFDDLGMQQGGAGQAGFIVGLLTGFLCASVLFSIVGSAVNTVIVCFAEAPRELEQNHPQLSQELRAAWTQAWPGIFS